MRRTLSSAMVAVSILSGIGVAPAAAQADRPADSAAAVLTFWRQMGDTTLNRLMSEALGANLDVRAGLARLSGARADRLGAVLDLAPTVTARGGYTRQRLSPASFPVGVGSLPDQDIWDAGLEAGWEVDVFGRLRKGLRGEGALVAAAREDVRGVRVAVMAELAQAYFDLRGAQERLGVAQRNAENQRRTLDLTQQRLDAGKGTAFDTERARAQLNFTLASIPDLETAVARAAHRVGVLVGRSPAAVATELDCPNPQPSLPELAELPDRDSILALRPDVAAARRRVAAGDAFVGVAKADYLPRLSVGGSAGFASAALDGFGGHGTFRYAVGPTLSWPLFDLGRVKAGVQAASARRDEAEAQYRQTVLQAAAELATAQVEYRSARAKVERITEAAAASAHAAELARLRFTDGVADFLQVLDAERTELDAESQLAQSRAQAATALAGLYRALGGVWTKGA
jgi:outer membrane protein, multidrug efflux system